MLAQGIANTIPRRKKKNSAFFAYGMSSSFFAAIVADDAGRVAELLAAGSADANAPDASFAGARLRGQDAGDLAPVLVAALAGATEVAGLLLSLGADPCAASPEAGETLAVVAAAQPRTGSAQRHRRDDTRRTLRRAAH